MNKGTSRKLRKNDALRPESISVDERSLLDLVKLTLDFSEYIHFYGLENTVVGNWQSFLKKDSTFVLARIATVDTSIYKLNDALFEDDQAESSSSELVKQTNSAILDLIRSWQVMLDQANHQGPVLTEIRKFLYSLDEDIQRHGKTIKEIYENYYGNLVYLRGRAANWFREDLMKTTNQQPHIALLLSFFKLFRHVQNDMNETTSRHLDYYFIDLLQQQQKKTGQHTAIVSLQLMAGTEKQVVQEGEPILVHWHGNQQIEFRVASSEEINQAEIAEIRTLFKGDYSPLGASQSCDEFLINYICQNTIVREGKTCFGPGEFPAAMGEESALAGDGENQPVRSEIGFLVSSPALILEKGRQQITLSVKLSESSFRESTDKLEGLIAHEISRKSEARTDKKKITEIVVSKFFSDAFSVFITDEKAWKQIHAATTRFLPESCTLCCELQLNQFDDNLIPFDTKIHEGSFDTDWPCIKLILNNEAQYHPFRILENCVVEDISITASVHHVNNLILSNTAGRLDTSVPFAPFGASPAIGNYLRIQNPLILQKNLSALDLHFCWAGFPLQRFGFADYYRNYPDKPENSSFKAVLSQSRNITNGSQANQQVFDLFKTGGDYLIAENTIHLQDELLEFTKRIDPAGLSGTDPNSLFMVLSHPEQAFGHQLFTELYAEAALKRSRFRKSTEALPNQPYTPVMEHISVNYSNTAKEVVSRKQDENGSDIKLVQIYPFGHLQVFPGPVRSPFYLLPQIRNKGNLMIGLKKLRPGDVVSIGFELVPAVYVHTAIHAPVLSWEYLVNNEWESLEPFLLEDTTGDLIRSGIVKIQIPPTVQFEQSRMPSGSFWIKAVYDGDEELNSRIINLFTQAVQIRSENELPAGFRPENQSIAKLSFEGKKGIDAVSGLYSLKLNVPAEDEHSFYIRVSERLRHKNRALTAWDIERLVLDNFHQVDKVRVYGRSSHPQELVKGSCLQLVLIPKNEWAFGTGNRPAAIDFSTLLEVKKFISAYLSPFVKAEVSNPVYEQLKVRCRVKFNDVQKSGFLRNMLNDELISYLSPDIENESIDKGFDESISKTEILNFIESRSYVDYVTEFSVLQIIEAQGKYKIIDTAVYPEIKELCTISAYAILTSAPEHQIGIVKHEAAIDPQKSGIGDLGVAADFIISGNGGKYN